jgi:acetyl/propionyl-CoA carboxylase alpha subunit
LRGGLRGWCYPRITLGDHSQQPIRDIRPIRYSVIEKLLVANRGEIALRVMRSAREMGIRTVAVYSDADRGALHVRYADEAHPIGPPPSSQSYLLGDKIIEVALKCGADAIHPGYGFLSENAAFAAAVEKAGITFVGPSARSMEIMGNKLAAKEAVAKYNIPMVPGSAGAISDEKEAKKIARDIGYPVLIKAAAGGGGKGMRIVQRDEELSESISRAMSEAQSAFGDGSVFIEKYVTNPHHIEVQVMADKHGNTCYLFERECSIQRRHQKVVEEAPSPIITPEMRKKMGEAAVMVAKACDYVGAGTVEFLVSASPPTPLQGRGNAPSPLGRVGEGLFFFLEMNTRLQVEHPVTELITGLDLVKEQLRVAMGERLSFTQDELSIRGHAIELRVYAEDPMNNFLPSVARLKTYQRPQGPGVRVDDGYEEGMDIPIYYDPLIAKLISWGADRQDAIARMKRAISEYQVTGPATTLPFGEFVMNHEAFVAGNYDTKFVEQHFAPTVAELTEEEAMVAAVVAGEVVVGSASTVKHQAPNGDGSRWRKARMSSRHDKGSSS